MWNAPVDSIESFGWPIEQKFNKKKKQKAKTSKMGEKNKILNIMKDRAEYWLVGGGGGGGGGDNKIKLK